MTAEIHLPECPKYFVCHSDHGDPECCGLIMVTPHGEHANLKCNECGTVFGTFTNRAEAEHALGGMAGNEIISEPCSHCGHLNIIRGLVLWMLMHGGIAVVV